MFHSTNMIIEMNQILWHYCIIDKMQLGLHQFLDSIVVSIPACHAGDRGSIPRRGDILSNLKKYSLNAEFIYASELFRFTQ